MLQTFLAGISFVPASVVIALKGRVVPFLGLFSKQLFSMDSYSWSNLE